MSRLPSVVDESILCPFKDQVTKAWNCLMRKDFKNAYLTLMTLYNYNNDVLEVLQNAYLEALVGFAGELFRAGDITRVVTLYETATEIYLKSENANALNMIGSHIFMLGQVDWAFNVFSSAVAIDSTLLGARENLDNIKSMLVERWHFRMLNDRDRNKCFYKALENAVKKGCNSVLDIGTGTGLLAMFASKLGAPEVFACEMSGVMYETAKQTIEDNHLSEKIMLIHKKSTQLQIPADIPHKVKLVVCEIFDTAVFGEGLLPTLTHAWKHLLEPDAKVIPRSVTMYVCAIESDYIRTQNRCIYPGLESLDFGNLIFETSRESEPYSSERLNAIPGKVKYLTKLACLPTVELSDIERLNILVSGHLEELQLKVRCSGRVDALALWFTLQIGDDPAEQLTSSPKANSCWEQAVYPVLPRDVGYGDLCVYPGNHLVVKCLFTQGFLALGLKEIQRVNDNGEVTKEPGVVNFYEPDECTNSRLGRKKLLNSHWVDEMRLWKYKRFKPTCSVVDADNSIGHVGARAAAAAADSESVISASIWSMLDDDVQNLFAHYLPSKACEREALFFDCSQKELMRLNDLYYQRFVLQGLREGMTQYKENHIMVISNGLPFLGLQLLKQGASSCYMIGCRKMTRAVKELCQINDIEYSRLCNGDAPFESMDKKYNIVFIEATDADGCMKQKLFDDIAYAATFCVPKSIVIPHRLVMYGMVVESQQLITDSMVLENTDQATMGFTVHSSINSYMVRHHPEVELSKLPYKSLSLPCELLSMDLQEVFDNPESAASYTRTKRKWADVVEDGTAHAVIYWFNWWLTPFSNLKVITTDARMGWKQAAILQGDSVVVHQGDAVQVTTMCRNNCICAEVTGVNKGGAKNVLTEKQERLQRQQEDPQS